MATLTKHTILRAFEWRPEGDSIWKRVPQTLQDAWERQWTRYRVVDKDADKDENFQTWDCMDMGGALKVLAEEWRLSRGAN